MHPHVAQALTLLVTQRKYVGKVKIKEGNESVSVLH